VHIAEGFLPAWSVGAGWAVTAGATAVTLPALGRGSPPRVAMVTSTFFVASLLAFPLAGTSVHLSLLGLAGVILGRAAFPAVLVGVALQAALLRHGGLTTIGVNALTMGAGALVAAAVYHVRPGPRRVVRAGAAAALGTLVALALYGAALLSAGKDLRAVAWVCLALHAPVVVVEALVAAQAVAFLTRVEPSLVLPAGSALDREKGAG